MIVAFFVFILDCQFKKNYLRFIYLNHDKTTVMVVDQNNVNGL